METVGSPALWLAFSVGVCALLVVDLGLHRKAHTIGLREAAAWSAAWIALALLFCLGLYLRFGSRPALEFLTGYTVEKALSVDNLFVFLVLLRYFHIPASLQHRVLFWGILGAIVLRAVFIFAGARLLTRFHFLIYAFGAFLVATGIRLLLRPTVPSAEGNRVVRLVQRLFPVSPMKDAHFFVRLDGRLGATPLFLALVTVEITDVIFAVDSIPAIFAVTLDPFLVYTSNIFAILGLRSLYFVLAGIMTRWRFLHLGLALVLSFVGVKMILSDLAPIPIAVSLAVILLILIGSIVASLAFPKRMQEHV